VTQDLSTAEYRCPGESYGISRAVHLGRLASFHPACRDCRRRDDTFGLSARHIRQLAEIGFRAQQPPWFCAEGVGKVAINDLSPNLARKIAIEFARRITCPATSSGSRQPSVVVAGDGRLATAAIVAAIVEGVRWTGCETIDIGPASAPCAARAIQHLAADGGVFVGNAHGAPHTVGLKFWAHGEPLSQGGLLGEIAASVLNRFGEAMIDRPTRTFGTLRRHAATDFYLGDLRPAYHALRPLRFVLDCTTGPIVAYLEELVRNVACQIIFSESTDRPGEQEVGWAELRRVPPTSFWWDSPKDLVRNNLPIRKMDLRVRLLTPDGLGGPSYSFPHSETKPERATGNDRLAEQVVAAQAHFGMRVDDDGENCRVVDEQGQSVAAERLLALVAGSCNGPALYGEELRQKTFRRMQESGASIAADASGRLWYASGHAPLPDALQTLTHLLVLLSRNDMAFSAIVNDPG
jgi:phosphomannomutase